MNDSEVLTALIGIVESNVTMPMTKSCEQPDPGTGMTTHNGHTLRFDDDTRGHFWDAMILAELRSWEEDARAVGTAPGHHFGAALRQMIDELTAELDAACPVR